MARKKMIAGNWKMYKTVAEGKTLLAELKAKVKDAAGVDIVVCPPFTTLSAAAQELQGTHIQVGAQNVHWEFQGAFTGEISAPMLREIPVAFVIVGHSERRQYNGETDETVNTRLKAALGGGLLPIVCIGETLAERDAGKTEAVVERQIRIGLAGLTAAQLAKTVIAYEPVWAIGTGRTATPAQAQEVHAFIRGQLTDLFGAMAAEVRILYGGSVKPENARQLMAEADIDGALVGGASLKAADFTAIVDAAR